MPDSLYTFVKDPLMQAYCIIQLAFAPIFIIYILSAMISLRFRMPFSAWVMLTSVIINYSAEIYPSIYIILMKPDDKFVKDTPFLICFIFIGLTFLSYLYFAMQLKIVRVYIESTDALEMRIKMKVVRNYVIVFVSLIILMAALGAINYFLFKDQNL